MMITDTRKIDRLDQITTMERLQCEVSAGYGSVLQYGDYVLTADIHWQGGFQLNIYEFIETPEETGLGAIECRISHIARPEGNFPDGGHAIAWGIAYLAIK